MNWADFKTRHEDCDQAFETFGRHLFSKWCKYNYKAELKRIIHVGGKGGDGGVEAFARLEDNSVIGFQCKWFRDKFDTSQVNQIRSSINSAKKRHPSLSKYIVCMPFELQGSKGRGNAGTAEYERWEALCNYHSDIELILWDDTNIEQVALDIGLQDLMSYWFNGNYINQSEWLSIFERKRAAWFDSRYIPDLHMQGKYDELIRERLLTSRARCKYLETVNSFHKLLENVVTELRHLPDLYNWDSIESSEQSDFINLSTNIECGVELVDELQKELRCTDSLKKMSEIFNWYNELQTKLTSCIGIIEKYKPSGFTLSPMSSCKKVLAHLQESSDDFISLMHYDLSSCNLTNIILGDAGSGKTHSALDVARSRLEEGFPALIIPAKAIDPSTSSTTWLSNYLDKPNWSLAECFQAMEVSAFSQFEEIEGANDDKNEFPARFLLVIDGLEESIHNNMWQETLNEWGEIIKNYPRIKLICTCRPAYNRNSLKLNTDLFCNEQIDSQNTVPLHELFMNYCQKYNIEVNNQAWVKWVINSPREIRLFSEIYQNQKLDCSMNLDVSVTCLMKKIITQLEDSLKSSTEYGWNYERSILLKGLRNYTNRLISQKLNALEYSDMIKAFKNEDTDLNNSQLTYIFDGLVSSGLIDKRIVSSKSTLDDDLVYFHPANQSVIDFLIAYSAYEGKQKNENNEVIISSQFSNYYEPLALFLQMLNEKDNIYINEISFGEPLKETIEDCQLVAISRSHKEVSTQVKEWIKSLFLQNKVTNRSVLKHLAINTARNARHWCSSKFFHDILIAMTVAGRDILWSCPDYLSSNCEGVWEGYADFILDEVSLYKEDKSAGIPLLLAWSCSSVVAKRTRTARSELAKWGSENPLELSRLLELMSLCNDSQVLENLFTASAGAACLTDDQNGLKKLAEQCHKMLFSESPCCKTKNSASLHAARIVIEKAFCFQLVSEEFVKSARPPYNRTGKLLPFMNPNEEDSDIWRNPISGDLDWYVIKNASKGFFERKNTVSHSDDNLPKKEVIDAILKGEISINPQVMGSIKTISNKHKNHQQNTERLCRECSILLDRIMMPSAYADDEEKCLSEETSIQNNEENSFLKELLGNAKDENKTFSKELVDLLNSYKKEYNLTNLTPEVLRNGLVLAFIYEQGWSSDAFIGKPNGGKDGEILGADLSITRQHWSSTHGSRSPICSYAEKYVWMGVNEIAGYFAERLPVIDDFGNFSLEENYGNIGEEMSDPFDGLVDIGSTSDDSGFEPFKYFEEYEADGENLIEKSTDWVKESNWPDFKSIISTGNNFRVCSFMHGREPNYGTIQLSRASCLIIPQSSFEIFKRDALGGAIKFRDTGGDVSCAGIDGDKVYNSPLVTCWAPWEKSTDDCWESYNSVDDNGSLFHINLRYLSAKIYWNCNGEETITYLPSPFYAKDLDIVRGDGTTNQRVYQDNSGFPVAEFRKSDSVGGVKVEELIINSDRFDGLLKKKQAVAVWFIEGCYV